MTKIEVMTGFTINSIDVEQPVPPYDHYIYTFEATCISIGYSILTSHSSYPAPMQFILKGDGEDFPFYIDSYERCNNNNTYYNSYDNNFITVPFDPEFTIHGHFDSRDFEEEHNGPCRFKKKEPTPILNRWEILDL